MGIDYYVCTECGKGFPDVHEYGHCASCEGILCEDCKADLWDKHGECTDFKFVSHYGSGNPKTCSSCVEDDLVETVLDKVYDLKSISDIDKDIFDVVDSLPRNFEGKVEVSIRYREEE